MIDSIKIILNTKIKIENLNTYKDIRRMKIGLNLVLTLRDFGLDGYCGTNQT